MEGFNFPLVVDIPDDSSELVVSFENGARNEGVSVEDEPSSNESGATMPQVSSTSEKSQDYSSSQSSSNNGATVTSSPDSALVNVNSATLSELKSLPGIGDAYANKILQNRPYESISELKTKAGIPTCTITKISDLVTY